MQLDDAFANAPYIDGAAAYPPAWAADAEAFRTGLGGRAECGVPYGGSDRQAFDFFASDAEPAGTVVFVHGGYWLKFDKSYWSHFGKGPLAHGWNVAMPGYDLCPDVTIAAITTQIAAAVTAIAGRVAGPLALTGHSAGGHLVSRMLAPGMLPAPVLERIVRVAPVSPVADLRPLLQTSMNSDFRMDMAGAEAESPVLQPAPDTPVKVWVGAEERPVFLQQAAELAGAWGVEDVVVPERHHFDVIDALKDPESDLTGWLTS